MAQPGPFGIFAQYGPYAIEAAKVAKGAYDWYQSPKKSMRNYHTGIGAGFNPYNKISKNNFRKLAVQCGENKFIDIEPGSKTCYVIATNALNVHLSDIPTGDTIYTRMCKKVIITGICARGKLLAGTTQTIPRHCGFEFIVDKRPRGSIATAADIWKTDNDPARLTEGDNASRFKHILRKTYLITGDGDALANAYNVGKSIQIYKKCYIPVEWESSDTTGDIDYVVRNALLYCVLGDGANDTTSPTVDLKIRIYFKDAE